MRTCSGMKNLDGGWYSLPDLMLAVSPLSPVPCPVAGLLWAAATCAAWIDSWRRFSASSSCRRLSSFNSNWNQEKVQKWVCESEWMKIWMTYATIKSCSYWSCMFSSVSILSSYLPIKYKYRRCWYFSLKYSRFTHSLVSRSSAESCLSFST